MITQEQKNIILAKLTPYKPSTVGVFGSYARNENTKDSDLDILVDFEQVINLFELVGIELELSEELGIKVDLVTQHSVSKSLQPYISRDFFRLI